MEKPSNSLNLLKHGNPSVHALVSGALKNALLFFLFCFLFCADTRSLTEVLRAGKVQLTWGQGKAARRTLELVLIQEHLKGKARYEIKILVVNFKQEYNRRRALA